MLQRAIRDRLPMEDALRAIPSPWLLLPLALLALLVFLVVRELSSYHLQNLIAALRQLRAAQVGAAAALTLLSYLLLGRYELLGFEYARRRVSAWRAHVVGFVAFAIGHNISLAAFTGAAIRFRLYARDALTAGDIARVSLFCSATTGLGLLMLFTMAMLGDPLASAGALHLPYELALGLGAGALVTLLGYVYWASQRRATLLRLPAGWALRPPGARLVARQLLLATCDLLCAASALWVLLPSAPRPDYAAFIGVYALACVAGIVSHVPGGLGVFESVLLLGRGAVPTEAMLASLLVYRLVYYVLPLLGAGGVLLGSEAQRLAGPPTRWRPQLRALAGLLAPWIGGAGVFLAGLVLLLSGATPAIDARITLLRRLLPLPVLELSHLAGSIIGFVLLVLARALQRRASAAYHLTMVLLLAGIGASLLKGFDYEEALLLGSVALLLRAGRAAFYRPSSKALGPFQPGWIATLIGISAIVFAAGVLSHGGVPYANELWWTFAFRADAPRALRAALAVALLGSGLMLFQWLRPAAPAARTSTPEELDRARRVISTSATSLGNAALAGDKQLLFTPDDRGFLMYQRAGRCCVALGDPVAPPEAQEQLVWQFRERCDRDDSIPVFYQVSAARLALYVDLGLSALKLGEEARVPLNDFSLQGPNRADLRQSHRRALRDGASFAVLPGQAVPGVLPELHAVSESWLAHKHVAEKGFSVGAFSPRYLAEFPVAVVRDGTGIVAFANLWPTTGREELSIDLMRFTADAPHGVMDFLLIELMLWGCREGYQWFNLGMAPLAGLQRRPLAPAWQRFGHFVYRHGEHFYNFDGLRRYKAKFDPVWEPRYLISPGGLAVPRVLTDVSLLISGGLRELVTR